jgi:hypothetical protein
MNIPAPIKPSLPKIPVKPEKTKKEEKFISLKIHDGMTLQSIIDYLKNEGVTDFTRFTHEQGTSDSYESTDSKFSGYAEVEVSVDEYNQKYEKYLADMKVFTAKLTDYEVKKAKYDIDYQLYIQATIKEQLIKEAAQLDTLKKKMTK